MPASTPNQDPFDLRRIRRFVELMEEHDLTEVDIREGDTRIRLRRGGEPAMTFAAPHTMAAPAASHPANAAASAESAKADEAHVVPIKSPIVGTFYAAPIPTRRPTSKSAITSARKLPSASSRP